MHQCSGSTLTPHGRADIHQQESHHFQRHCTYGVHQIVLEIFSSGDSIYVAGRQSATIDKWTTKTSCAINFQRTEVPVEVKGWKK